MLGDGDDRITRDAGENRVSKWRGVDNASAHEKEILTRAFREVAVPVERDAFDVAVGLGFHVDELRVHVICTGLRKRGHSVWRKTVPRGDTNVSTFAYVDVLAPWEVRDVNLNRRLRR